MPFPQLAQHGVFGVEIGVFLVVTGDFDKPPRLYGGIFSAYDFADERGFSRAVVPDDGAFFPAHNGERGVFEQRPFSRLQLQSGHLQHPFVRPLGVGEGKAGRGGRQLRLFQNLHFFQLFHAAERRLRGGGPHEISIYIILQMRDFFLLFFVFL